MRQGHAMWFGSDKERQRLTAWCGLFAAFGWVILEAFFELLFGPHVGLMSSLAIGSGIGVAAGLLTSTLQWLVLHSYFHNAGTLIPATTVGSTLAGLVGGFLLHSLNQNAELYTWSVPMQGAFGAVFVCLTTAHLQWMVLRNWAIPGHSWRSWVAITAAGSALGALCACVAVAAVTGLFGSMHVRITWHYILFIAYFTAGVTGGAIYGRFITWGLRMVFPGAMGEQTKRLGAESGI